MKFRVFDFKKRAELGHAFATITAYDAVTASKVEQAQIPMILVGDSVGTTQLGYTTTIRVTMADILHHCVAVRRGAPHTFIVADMPFGSYHQSTVQALENATHLIQQGGVDAVKLEGGHEMAPTIRALTYAGIPVVGHIGLLPQQVMHLGGYFMRGKTIDDEKALLLDAKAVCEAGAFMMVIECVLESVAQKITSSVKIPTIGIGAGAYCDAQIQVVNDLLGYSQGGLPKHATPLAHLNDIVFDALRQYKDNVEK